MGCDRGVEKPAPALFLPAERFRRRERGHHFLGLRRRDERHRLVGRERELEVAGRPQRPAKLVAALLLDGIEELARHPLLVHERGGRAADAHAKRRQLRIARLEHVAARRQRVRVARGDLQIDRRLVRPKMQRRVQLESHRPVSPR